MLYYNMDEGTLISGNTFTGNQGVGGEGGGLQIDENAAGTISKNVFVGNENEEGGGL